MARPEAEQQLGELHRRRIQGDFSFSGLVGLWLEEFPAVQAGAAAEEAVAILNSFLTEQALVEDRDGSEGDGRPIGMQRLNPLTPGEVLSDDPAAVAKAALLDTMMQLRFGLQTREGRAWVSGSFGRRVSVFPLTAAGYEMMAKGARGSGRKQRIALGTTAKMVVIEDFLRCQGADTSGLRGNPWASPPMVELAEVVGSELGGEPAQIWDFLRMSAQRGGLLPGLDGVVRDLAEGILPLAAAVRLYGRRRGWEDGGVEEEKINTVLAELLERKGLTAQQMDTDLRERARVQRSTRVWTRLVKVYGKEAAREGREIVAASRGEYEVVHFIREAVGF